MKDKIPKYFPVGVPAKKEKSAITAGIILSVLYSFSYFLEFTVAKNALYEYKGRNKILVETREMRHFHELTDGCLNGFVVMFFMLLILIALHYAYHFRDSKSIYTMKRLPHKNELLIRCTAVPLVSLMIIAFLSAALLFIFYNHYMIFTPEECLVPGQFKAFVRHIIYGGA